MDLSAIIKMLKDFETFGKNIVGLLRFFPEFLGQIADLASGEKATGLEKPAAEAK